MGQKEKELLSYLLTLEARSNKQICLCRLGLVSDEILTVGIVFSHLYLHHLFQPIQFYLVVVFTFIYLHKKDI